MQGVLICPVVMLEEARQQGSSEALEAAREHRVPRELASVFDVRLYLLVMYIVLCHLFSYWRNKQTGSFEYSF
jgi:hypothetical protein